MFPEKTHIRICSVSEYIEVTSYYSLPENGEMRPIRELTIGNCLRYPYITRKKKDLTKITARSVPYSDYKVIEFGDWLNLINADDFDPVPQDDFERFITGG